MDNGFLATIGKFFQVEYVIPVGSGTVGLFLALRSIDVQHQKVIIPILACPDVAIAVMAAGGRPIAVDVSSDDYNIDPISVEGAMDDSVKAIIAVDAFGYPANIQTLRQLAASHGCVLIEDACQAYGGEDNGVPLGGRGDIGIISFGYSKPLALNGGGFLLTNSGNIFAEVNRLRSVLDFNHLRDTKNKIALKLMMTGHYRTLQFLSADLGLLHYDMPSHVARVLPQAWQRFSREREQVRSNLNVVKDLVPDIQNVEPFRYKAGEWLPWRYSFKVADARYERELKRRLQLAGIRVTSLYRPMTDYLNIEVKGTLTNANSLKHKTRNLYYQTTEPDTHRLVQGLESVIHQTDWGTCD
jgi:dTDP-4-amino-4,6-dideoxygalactose transaminase